MRCMISRHWQLSLVRSELESELAARYTLYASYTSLCGGTTAPWDVACCVLTDRVAYIM